MFIRLTPPCLNYGDPVPAILATLYSASMIQPVDEEVVLLVSSGREQGRMEK